MADHARSDARLRAGIRSPVRGGIRISGVHPLPDGVADDAVFFESPLSARHIRQHP